jgi:serine/threonine protein kinase
VEILHKAGIEHGDLAPQNVTRDATDDSLWLIDFSNSHVHSHCKGRACPEIAVLRRNLRLPEDAVALANRRRRQEVIFAKPVFGSGSPWGLKYRLGGRRMYGGG